MSLGHTSWCTEAGQPAVYKELSVTLFMSGYLVVMETVKPALKPIFSNHLKQLMANAEVYGWAAARAYHTI